MPVGPERTVDGTLEEAWNGSSAALAGFILEGGEQLADPQTEVYVSRTADKLFFFFMCHEQKPEDLVASAEDRDDPVWRDDSVELFITSPTEKDVYYHLLVSSKGVIQDAKVQENQWNGDWEVSTARRRSACLQVPSG